MSLNRYAKRRDENEPELVAAAVAVGADVWRLDQPVDLLIFYRDRFFMAEVKVPGKRNQLKPSQRVFLETVGAGAPAAVVTTVDELLCFIGATE